MKYVEYRPAPPLLTFINCFWSIEPDADEVQPSSWDRTVPDGSLEFVVHLDEPMLRKSLDGFAAQESRTVLIGQTTQPYLIAPAGRTRMLGVRFFPHTGFLFLDGPVAPFNDISVDLDAIFPRRMRLPVERAGNAGSITCAVRVLEHWCLQRLKAISTGRRDGHFAQACRTILHKRGGLSITGLAGDLGIGSRHLERVFLERSGIPPKLFARIIRFQHALGKLTGEAAALAAVAQETGHADQSHFVREFRRFTGLAPREFMRERHPFTQHFAEPSNSSHLYNFR